MAKTVEQTQVAQGVAQAVGADAPEFACPTKVVNFTYHFKRISAAKKPEEFALMEQAAADFDHVTVTVEEVRNEAGDLVDTFIKRNSEVYPLVVPDYEALLASVCLGEQGEYTVAGVTTKEFTAVQAGVESAVEALGRTLVDGSAATDEDGNYTKTADNKFHLEGFGIPTAENCSFALAAAAERTRGGAGGAGKATIPAELRDAGVASLVEYLKANGVPAQGQELYAKLAKSYYSRNVAAALTPDAIKLTATRVSNWYASLDGDEQERFALFHTRLQDKAAEMAAPRTTDTSIL